MEIKKGDFKKPVSNVQMIATDKDGNLIGVREFHNTDVAIGREACAGLQAGIVGYFPFTQIGVGESGTAITDADTGLGITTTRGASTSNSLITTTTLNDTGRYQAVITFPGTFTIRKTGLFQTGGNLQSSGMGFVSLVSPNLTMPSGSAITIIWTVQNT